MAYAIQIRSGQLALPARSGSRKASAALWTLQGVLATVFLFTGGTKLLLPLEELTAQMPLPGLLVRFIGLCELAGALGLVLPGLLRIKPVLTPLAASGLAIIMIGATIATLAVGGGATALLPVAVGVLAGLVVRGRREWLGQPARRA